MSKKLCGCCENKQRPVLRPGAAIMLFISLVYLTVTVHEAVRPLADVAVMTAVPGAMALILPLAFTVATDGLLLVKVTVLKSVFLGITVALIEADLPVFRVSTALESLSPVGCIGVTVTVQLTAAPLPSFAVQVMTAVPADLPVTTPALETTATFLLLDVHLTFLLLAVKGEMAAVSFTFCARITVVSAIFSVIEATGCLTVTVFLTVVVFVLILPFLSVI